jgi:glycosyltransferase involved in cell wall biosynthesis
MPPSVSIIIASRNRAEALRNALASIQRTTLPTGTDVELILIDNGSSDETQEVMHDVAASNLKVRVLEEPRPGKARALNRGLDVARGTALLFTDDDVRVPADWIQNMSAPILNGTADAVAGGIRLAPHLRRSWMTQAHMSLLADTAGLFGDDGPSRLVGANMALHRRVFDVVPKFDEALGPGALGLEEDTLLGHQIQAADFRTIGAPTVVVEHHPNADRLTRDAFLASLERLGRSGAYVDYHWRHAQASRLRSTAAIIYWTARLTAWRIGHLQSVRSTEGIDPAEMPQVRAHAYHRQMQQMAGSPRAYDRQEWADASVGGSDEPSLLRHEDLQSDASRFVAPG